MKKLQIGTKIKYNSNNYTIVGYNNTGYKVIANSSNDTCIHIQYEASITAVEEMKINLCELLKSCEGEEFYSPVHGTIKLVKIDESKYFSLIFETQNNARCVYSMYGYTFLNCSPDALITLYPSYDLYIKYPLNTIEAWKEWEESRKPKRWRAKKGEIYYCFNNTLEVEPVIEMHNLCDDGRYSFGNYFCTRELAKQACEKVKECLMEFHKQHEEE